VFVQADGTAYMIPRPDGHPALFFACRSGNEQPFKQILDRYLLCQEQALSAEQVEVVNAMVPADALAIAHVLHERLVFVAGEAGVRPYAFPGDILELCNESAAFRAGPLKERCDFELEAAASGARNEIGWSHTGEQGVVLADALNGLYGIEGGEKCDRLSSDASLSLSRVIEAARGPCTSDADCIGIGHSSACHDACGSVIAATRALDVNTARAVINGEQCAPFERASCTLIVPPCTPPAGGPACLAGVCGVAER
jgi:hypothetical protein